MAQRTYRCAECGQEFTYECRGRPRVSCEDCAPARARRQINDWAKTDKAKANWTRRYEAKREEIIEKAVQWNRENPERRSQITRKHAAQPAAKARKAASKRNWEQANPHKLHAYSLLNRSRRRGAGPPDEDAAEYVAILRHDPCAYCGSSAGEIDHIVPIGAGGLNHADNFTAACRSCNAGKSANPLLIYLLRKG